ncbi:MAG: NifU N-terminal domain-containing protein [Anaerolineae bacterium]|nr:NifU N-terminal domain-containing protein [Anaerolineae bacterium]
MSEYVEIHTESGDEPDTLLIETNVQLAVDEAEQYNSVEGLEEGSPLAQALAFVPGIRQVTLEGRTMTVRHDPAVPLHVIVADISAVIRDFFL